MLARCAGTFNMDNRDYYDPCNDGRKMGSVGKFYIRFMMRRLGRLLTGAAVTTTCLFVQAAPSHAANVTGTDSTGVLGVPGGSGTSFGSLLPGDTFRINLLPYVLSIVDDDTSFNAIGAAISFGSGPAAFKDVGLIAGGDVDLGIFSKSFTDQPIALWGFVPVSATSKDVLSYTAKGEEELFNNYRTADFTLLPTGTLGQPRTASIGGLLAAATQFNLSNPTRFDLVGTYVGGGDNNTKINFGLASFTNRGTTGNPNQPKPGDLDFSTARFNGGFFTLKEDPEFIPVPPPEFDPPDRNPGPPGRDPITSATVPGPLPVLGAAAAFGWSRRLRKRIKT
ncbi:hypothetical protein KQ306_05015 [Synechococcus sp. CS-1324]|uniref:hypothetical protein n=1 Tax=Synechococcus sp. CS-1324 TaxID=2847980 RepID=UPI00223AD824|nr:hypothetical protein [Synechococcus sp. CS-1324]MCT0230221.1 hypothetical protein [Synechococcus sp. CS-1324]